MSDPIEVRHALPLEEALARLRALAHEHDVALEAEEGGRSGSIEKSMGWLGKVRGRFRIETERVEVAIESAPTMVGEATVRRFLAEALEQAFGA